MNGEPSFGALIKERRRILDLTQAELARRVACATITIRKIEADALRSSQQIAERMAMALAIPLEARARFVALARALSLADQSPPPPTPAPAPEEIGQADLSGRAIRGYELGERLGEGGFGAVYRAVQPLIEREVAIKIVLPQYANHPDFIRRFEAEAQLVARLEHPYIVPLYDYWREPGVAYLVMRLMRGGTLHDKLKDGPLPPEAVAVLLEQIGAALYAAHRVGVIHRDLKPANILLDEDGNGYLADFGIAKNLSDPRLQDLTQVGVLVGSPAYISPEQIRAEPVRPQADVYCLGLLLYEMLTGQRAFIGPTPIDYIQQHLHESLPSLPAHASFDAVIQRATAKDPLDRYPDVPSLLAEFHQTMSAESRSVIGEVPFGLASLHETLENPYKGLRPFGEADAGDFYGRETLAQELLGLLGQADDAAAGPAHDLARFLAVVGPSGSGKSSAVKAGLIPSLRQGGLPGSENWFIVDLMPGAHPLEELEAALLRVAVNPPESLLSQLKEDARGLLRAVRRILPADPQVELVLVIDQFEEVFTQVDDEGERALLLDSLVAAALDERSRMRIVVTMRADFVGRALEYVDFGDLLRQRSAFVLPLTPDELEQAIVGPALRAGVTLEAGLVSTIVQDVGDQPGVLPLLQYALTELFERRQGRLLTLTAYHESGGVTGALARRAEELYVGLDEAGQSAARQMFLRMIALGEGVGDARRRVPRSELEALTPALDPSPARGVGVGVGAAMDTVLDLYGRYRLLTFDLDPSTRGPTAEVAHEALIREWPRLRGWLDESRADIRMQRQVAAAAREWAEAKQEASFLLRGARLGQFEVWAAGSRVALTYDERAYLEAGVAEREREEAEERERRERELVQALALAEEQQRRAESEKRRAEESTRSAARLRGRAAWLAVLMVLAVLAALTAGLLGNQARARSNDNATLVVQNVFIANTAQAGEGTAQAASTRAVSEQRVALTAQANEAGQRNLAETRQAVALTAQVQEAAQKATAQAASTIAVEQKDKAEYQARVALSNQLAAQSHAYLDEKPDLAALLSVQSYNVLAGRPSRSSLARVLQQTDPYLIRMLSPSGGNPSPNVLTFSPDGQMVAAAQSGGSFVDLWDVKTGQYTRQMFSGCNLVGNIAFSSDGRILATGCQDGTIQLRYTTDGQLIAAPQFYQDDYVDALAFSPNGRVLATGRNSGPIDLWSLAALVAGQSPQIALIGQPLVGHTGLIRSLTFSLDGQVLASGGTDNNILLWDMTESSDGMPVGRRVGPPLTGPAIPLPPIDAEQIWRKPQFSPDGKTIVSSGCAKFDPDQNWVCVRGEVRKWDISALYDLPAGDQNDADIDPVGRSIAADLVQTSRPLTDYSQDGALLAVQTDDTTIVFLDAMTGEPVGTPLTGHLIGIAALAFSPDGTILAVFDYPSQVRLWDVPAALGQRAPLRQGLTRVFDRMTRYKGTLYADVSYLGEVYKSWVMRAVVSPDERFLAAQLFTGAIVMWDLSSGQVITQSPSGQNPIAASGGLSFSPDGRRLISGRGRFDPATGQFSEVGIAMWQVSDAWPWELTTSSTTDDRVAAANVTAFSPDGTLLASSHWWNGTVRLWDGRTGEPIGPILTVDHAVADCLAFSPDGRLLATGGYDGLVLLWDVADPASARQVGGPFNADKGWVTGCTFSPDGRSLLVGYFDATVVVWDIASGAQIGSPLPGRYIRVNDLIFSADGQTLITNNEAGAVFLWDWPTRQPLVDPLLFAAGHFMSLMPGGKELVSGHTDGIIRFTDIDFESWKVKVCNLVNRNLTRAEWEQYLPGYPYEKTCPQWLAGE